MTRTRWDMIAWNDPKWNGDETGNGVIEPYAFIHPECGKPAFYMKQLPQADQNGMYRFASADAVLLDGQPPMPSTVVICGSCRKVVRAPDIQRKNIVEVIHLKQRS